MPEIVPESTREKGKRGPERTREHPGGPERTREDPRGHERTREDPRGHESRRAAPAIREELVGLLAREAEFEDIGKPLGWRTMPIYYRGERQASFPAEECPQTMGALGKLRLAGETVAFQRQSPGTGLPRHVDPCSWVVACHVGMVCPTGEEGGETPYISVAGEKYHWREGEVMVFDPSFKHETFNPTSQDRIILNIDLFHPELTDLECRVIQETIRLKTESYCEQRLFTPAAVNRRRSGSRRSSSAPPRRRSGEDRELPATAPPARASVSVTRVVASTRCTFCEAPIQPR